MTLLGRGGHLDTPYGPFDVLILADHVVVSRGRTTTRHAVPNYGTGIGELAARPGFRIGWACFDDDADVLYFYDRDDDGFGYALNLACLGCSEWGYAPFRL